MTIETISFTGARGGSGTTTIATTFALHYATQLVGCTSDIAHVTGTQPGEPLNAGLVVNPTVEDRDGLTVIDAGTIRHPREYIPAANHRSYLVVRGPSYEGLRTFTETELHFDAAIVLHEPWRALGMKDAQTALNMPIEAVVDHDPSISRLVDAGLMITRIKPTPIKYPRPHAMKGGTTQ